MEPSKHVVVIGAGGNIGSHLVPHLARTPEIGRLTLVDRGRYAPRNVRNQEVPGGGIGCLKAPSQAARARRINPGLDVLALAEDVENLPLGALRADLIVACLDSRRARQCVNEAAARLGISWLDGGVLGQALLGRVTRYDQGAEQPCLECRWDDADYAALEQAYPCESAAPAAPPTAAPSGLGALVAALLALECRKLLRGETIGLPPGGELVVDAAHHRHFVTVNRRNPRCRRADHGAWPLEPLPGASDIQLGGLFDAARRRVGGNGDLALRIDGKRFARSLLCEDCGATRRVLRLAGSLRRSQRACRACGGRMVLTGFGLVERIEAEALSRAERRRPLSALGVRTGEVLTVGTAERELHLELLP